MKEQEHLFKWGVFFLFLLIFSVVSCKKKEVTIEPGSYTGLFWGKSGATPYYELNVPIEISSISQNSLIMNGDYLFERHSDSIYGSFHFDNKYYLIDPYLVGLFKYDDQDHYCFQGMYVALKDTSIPVRGTFEIKKD